MIRTVLARRRCGSRGRERWHGTVARGTVELRGQLWSRDGGPAPHVTAIVNGHAVASQRSWAPRFWIDSSVLAPGVNRVQLAARAIGGPVALTPEQELFRPLDAAPRSARRHLRLTVHDDGWATGTEELLDDAHVPPERQAIAFRSRRAVVFNLPDDLTGDFDVRLEAFGDATARTAGGVGVALSTAAGTARSGASPPRRRG